MIDAETLTAIGTLILAAVTYQTVREMQQQQKLNKLEREMSLVVGPLYSKIANEMLFGITDYEPNRYSPENEYHWSDYYDFWDGIIINTHLAAQSQKLVKTAFLKIYSFN